MGEQRMQDLAMTVVHASHSSWRAQASTSPARMELIQIRAAADLGLGGAGVPAGGLRGRAPAATLARCKHEAGMAQVLVRSLDDHVVARLKEKAAARGLSLERFLRDLLTEQARMDREEFIRRAAEIRARHRPDPTGRDSTAMIREMREARSDHLRHLAEGRDEP
jgi:plasmid stability protein